MVRYFLKRLGMMLVALFMIILLTFVIEHSIPGGPFTSDRKVTPEVEAALNEKYHLNDPLPKQFLDYLVGILHGDLGPSYKYTGKEVTDFISNGFPVSANFTCPAAPVSGALHRAASLRCASAASSGTVMGSMSPTLPQPSAKAMRCRMPKRSASTSFTPPSAASRLVCIQMAEMPACTS